jgi:tetratricopeptide (TPR) repeat protein
MKTTSGGFCLFILLFVSGLLYSPASCGQDYRYSDYRLNYSGSLLGEEQMARINTWLERNDLEPGVRAVLHFYRGLHYRELKKYKFAITDLSDAIKLEPDFASAWYFRAQCYLGDKNLGKAIEDLSAAASIDPNHYETWVNRGNCYVLTSLTDSAISDYTRAISFHGAPAEIYSKRGGCYLEKGNANLAILDYCKAIDLDPKYCNAYLGRGNAYKTMGDQANALVNFTRAIELCPANRDAIYARAMIFHEMGKTAECKADLELLVNSDPRNPELCHKAAHCFAQINDFTYALKYDNQALILDPEFSQAAFCCGLYSIETRQYAGGREYFKLCLKLKHNNPQALLGLAVCCHALGMEEEKNKSLESAMKQEPLLRKGKEAVPVLQKTGWIFYPNETLLLEEIL